MYIGYWKGLLQNLTPKWNICHYLFTLMSFQTWMSVFSQRKNCEYYFRFYFYLVFFFLQEYADHSFHNENKL